MNEEDQVREAFIRYMTAEMELIGAADMEYEHPPYSGRFHRHFRRLVRVEKYFGGAVSHYRILRRVAIFVGLLVGLVGVNEISARTIGFNVWDYVLSYDSESEMYEISYNKNIHTAPKPLHDTPVYAPEGMKKLPDVKSGSTILSRWTPEGDTKGNSILYIREVISKEKGFSFDADDIHGIRTTIYYKDVQHTHAWGVWQDSDYGYSIDADMTEDARETLIRMVESIYEKK